MKRSLYTQASGIELAIEDGDNDAGYVAILVLPTNGSAIHLTEAERDQLVAWLNHPATALVVP